MFFKTSPGSQGHLLSYMVNTMSAGNPAPCAANDCYCPCLPVDPFTNMGFNFNPTWISFDMPSKLWDEVTYPFPNLNSANSGMDK